MTWKISLSISVSTLKRAWVRSLFLPLGCSAGLPLTGAVVILRGRPGFFPVADGLDFLVFRRMLPVSPIDDLNLSTRARLIVPSNPAAFHASLTALTLP